MANFRGTRPNDDWIYSTFYNDTPACFRFFYAFNHLRRPRCPEHDVESVCVPIETQNQGVRYGSKGSDVFWKCPHCRWARTITNGSYLFGLKSLQIFKVIKLLYKFYQGRTVEEASVEDGLNYELCRKWFDWFRRCISHYMQNYYYPNFQFDLSNPTEWDESSFAAKQKHGRGPVKAPVWVLGGVQRVTNLCTLQVVDRRNDATLIPIIHRHSVMGATIVTDAWSAYDSLNRYGYDHWSVNHSIIC